MTEKSEFKIFMRNAIKYLTFGFRMYENGVCDQPIKGDFKLVDSREMYGYTKKEASDLLGLSVRQFDRKIRKGDIRNGLASVPKGEIIQNFSNFALTGEINGGGNVMSLLDKTMNLTVVPPYGLTSLFATVNAGLVHALLTPPFMNTITNIGEAGCAGMYAGCGTLTKAADMPSLTTIGDLGCTTMYFGCTFDMSDNGSTLNFAFPTPPVTAGEITYATAYDVATWMGNTNGFEYTPKH